MAFRGWPAEAVEFYEGLEADNSKTYWQANKAVYEQKVKAPMEALLEQLGEFGPPKIFRPYRDVRFSADKTPYKTAMGAMAGGHYVQLSSAGLMAGAGYYHMARDQLGRFRTAVADERKGQALEAVVAAAAKAKIEIGGDSLKTAPRGYPKDHARIELLRRNGIIVWREWPVGAWLGTAKAADRVAQLWRDAAPLMVWLDKHVGPSTEPGR
jgi:uncharacterized protein (TIGR02453 family)